AQASANPSGGDVASSLESPGAALSRGTPTSAFLAGPGFVNGANHFATVVAYAGAGGSDTADLYDSAGDDVFQGQGSAGVLSGPGFSLTVNCFATVRATSSAGGTDHLALEALAYLFEQVGTRLYD